MHRIDLAVEGAAYPIFVGHDILGELGSCCSEQGLGRQVALVSDEEVAARYLEPATASLRAAGFQVLEVVYAGGEGMKNLAGAEGILAKMIEAEFDRSAWITALGGGVVGDMAGFVAATYLRGIPYVQVPTTIVAQVDSSIGGKTGVNHALGKNLIGAFHQPRLVLVDTDALRSLPGREAVAGMAEVLKHALIRDEELFSFLEDRLEEVVAMQLDAETLDWLIARNVKIKAAVVSADEREGGLRALDSRRARSKAAPAASGASTSRRRRSRRASRARRAATASRARATRSRARPASSAPATARAPVTTARRVSTSRRRARRRARRATRAAGAVRARAR